MGGRPGDLRDRAEREGPSRHERRPGRPLSPPSAPIGVVLAGGASSRLGRDKATLVLDPARGETLVERAATVLAPLVAEVLVADRGRDTTGGRWPSVSDGPGAGPAAGILGAAAARPGRDLLVLACDLPAAGPKLLGEVLALAVARPDADWVVPRRDGRLEPLCAVYRPRALRALDAAVRRGELAIHRLAEGAEIVLSELEVSPEVAGASLPPLFNLNSREDLALAREALLASACLAPPRRGE